MLQMLLQPSYFFPSQVLTVLQLQKQVLKIAHDTFVLIYLI